MNDSLELRKRILKMRQIYDVHSKSVKSINLNNPDSDLMLNKKDIALESNLNVIKNQKITKNKTEVYKNFSKLNLGLNIKKKTYISYNAQFTLLANKFNEAIEIILELSSKVEHLEKTVSLKEHEIQQINKHIEIPNLKIIVFIVLTSLFTLAVIYLPFNFLTLELILSDISSLI